MPIDLSNLNSVMTQANAVKTYSPKFFNICLTGAGKKIGLLTEDKNPNQQFMLHRKTYDTNLDCAKATVVNGDTTTNYIPMNPLPHDNMRRTLTPCLHSLWSEFKQYPYPDIQGMKKIGVIADNNGSADVYADTDIHSIIYEETKNKDGSKSSSFQACYQISLFLIGDTSNPICENTVCPNVSMNNDKPTDIRTIPLVMNTKENRSYMMFTCEPCVVLDDIEKHLLKIKGNTIDHQAVVDYKDELNLYDICCKRAEQWNTSIDKLLDGFFAQLATQPFSTVIPTAKKVVKELERYQVPLAMYINIYNALVKNFGHYPQGISEICKENLNLLLTDTLHNLNKNKAVLNSLGKPDPTIPLPTMAHSWSKEQQMAISTTEPLVLVQAGAGTGKSTVINGRMLYMLKCGIDPKDITVLSFTNAAADHISELNSEVHSMTIARMVHEIYSTNFTFIDPTDGQEKCKHELSSIETVRNCLDIYFPKDKLAIDFSEKLYLVKKNEYGALVDLNNFIEKNYDKVVRMLDTIGQTTLELEILICYQMIDKFKEPADVLSKFLIVDEVQDNSIFEFIYLIKYVDKHKESLYIVGDGSQTLYEFRGSDSKALNSLEGSGVFATYQLQINYRSNQEVLDFANIALNNIEANQFAHIQLQANSLKKVTEQTFKNKVHLHYTRLPAISDMKKSIGPHLSMDCKTYMDECLARGEQIAIIAYKREEIRYAEDAIKTLYPNLNPETEMANIIPERIRDSSLFSTFIKRYWKEIKFIPTNDIDVTIAQAIVSRSDDLMWGDKDANRKVLQRIVGQWRQENSAVVREWQRQYAAGVMSKDEFFGLLQKNLVDYEINCNSIRQSILSNANAQRKLQDLSQVKFIFSTIHSVKGLEFDNVIVIHRNENQMQEDDKRMFYVAFTRAKHSEYILSFGLVAKPKIQGDYDIICKTLHERDLEKARKAGKIHTVQDGKKTIEEIDDDFYDAEGNYAVASKPALNPVSNDTNDPKGNDDNK